MADYSWVGPVASAAGDMFTYLLNKYTPMSSKEKSRMNYTAGLNYWWSQLAANADFARNKMMLDYQNEYNSPAQQMARYRAAGLNPNLIYGQNNLSASAASSHSSQPAVQAPDTEFRMNPYFAEQLSNVLARYDEDSFQSIAREDAKAQLDSHRAEATSKQALSAIDVFNASVVAEEYINKLDDRNVRLEKERAEINHTIAQTNLTESQRNESIARLDKIDSEIKLNKARVDQVREQSKLVDYQIESLDANTALTRKKGVIMDNEDVRKQEDHDYQMWLRDYERMDQKAQDTLLSKTVDKLWPGLKGEEKTMAKSMLRTSGRVLWNVLKELGNVLM